MTIDVYLDLSGSIYLVLSFRTLQDHPTCGRKWEHTDLLVVDLSCPLVVLADEVAAGVAQLGALLNNFKGESLTLGTSS